MKIKPSSETGNMSIFDNSDTSKAQETRRTARILEIIQLIAIKPRQFRAADLGNRFEVSTRMIKKDFEVIRHGLLLDLSSSPDGYYFEHTPHLPALAYTFTEALALLQAAQVARRISGIDSAELAAAVARLEALFPIEFQAFLHTSVEPAQKTAQREHRQQMLRLLNRALLEGRKLEIVYETASRDGAISSRIVHPYHVMPYVRSWQLIAYCEKRQDILMFKVDRIHKAILLGTTFEMDENFDPESYIGNVWGVIRGEGLVAEEIVLLFEADAGRWVAEEFWHNSQRVEKFDDGRVIFRLTIPVTSEFVNWLLYYGSRVEVLEPQHLREKVGEEHTAASLRYR